MTVNEQTTTTTTTTTTTMTIFVSGIELDFTRAKVSSMHYLLHVD